MSNNQTQIKAEPGKQEVIIIREFEAPRELVFKAYTDPNLYKQWMGPRKYSIELHQFEPFDGGSWRYSCLENGKPVASFHGVNHEVLAPERIISTFEYEGLPEKGHVVLDTARFEVLPGNRTRVTTHSVFMSVADRDGMMQSGMEWGVRESHERLDELLPGMVSKEALV